MLWIVGLIIYGLFLWAYCHIIDVGHQAFNPYKAGNTPLDKLWKRVVDPRFAKHDPADEPQRKTMKQLKPRVITKDYDARFGMHPSNQSLMRDAINHLRESRK